jgi:hypothetical protein
MRFQLGPPPANPAFDPVAGGWTKLKEPNPWLMQLCALPIAVGVGVLLVGAITRLGNLQPSGLVPILAVLLLLLPVHELIHALIHPGNGRTTDSVLGFWPKKLACYAHYDGPLSRNRFIAVLIGPFVIMSVVPLLVEAILRINLTWVAVLSVVNGLAASGDIFACLLLLQAPRTAAMRNQGYYTWWQPGAPDCAT